jgi:hypothetical protein
MYTRFNRAATWSDDRQPGRPTLEPRRPPPRTLWAIRPWKSQAGRLVAVRMSGDGQLEVGVAGSPMRWIPAELALSPADAERWALIGFRA